MSTDTLLTGDNAAFLDLHYTAWLTDPASVGAEWRRLFESWEPTGNGHAAFVCSLCPIGILNIPLNLVRRRRSAPIESWRKCLHIRVQYNRRKNAQAEACAFQRIQRRRYGTFIPSLPYPTIRSRTKLPSAPTPKNPTLPGPRSIRTP